MRQKKDLRVGAFHGKTEHRGRLRDKIYLPRVQCYLDVHFEPRVKPTACRTRWFSINSKDFWYRKCCHMPLPRNYVTTGESVGGACSANERTGVVKYFSDTINCLWKTRVPLKPLHTQPTQNTELPRPPREERKSIRRQRQAPKIPKSPEKET